MTEQQIKEEARMLFPEADSNLIALDNYASQLFDELIKTPLAELNNDEFKNKSNKHMIVRRLYEKEYEQLAINTMIGNSIIK